MFILCRQTLKTGALALGSLALVTFNVGAQSPESVTKPAIKLAMIEGLSGPNGNAGEAVFRNLQWAVERVNARGGVKLAGVLAHLAHLVVEATGFRRVFGDRKSTRLNSSHT